MDPYDPDRACATPMLGVVILLAGYAVFWFAAGILTGWLLFGG